jgi:hypothetical protein
MSRAHSQTGTRIALHTLSPDNNLASNARRFGSAPQFDAMAQAFYGTGEARHERKPKPVTLRKFSWE